jgi:hypothetical protein
VSDRQPDLEGRQERARRCAACGTLHDPGDRFCAHCGAALSAPAETLPGATPSAERPEDGSAWVLGARPTAVIIGGIALLVLAVLLLAIGQRDDTGTIVMLSICTAPLGLLTLLIGIARYFAAVSRES